MCVDCGNVVAQGEDALLGGIGGGGKHGDVPHLPAFAHRHLAVNVRVKARLGQGGTERQVCRSAASAGSANQVEHGCSGMLGRIAQWQAEDGPEVLGKLGRSASLDGVVAGVVGPRGDLIDQDPALLVEEELNGEQAHKIHGLHDR